MIKAKINQNTSQHKSQCLVPLIQYGCSGESSALSPGHRPEGCQKREQLDFHFRLSVQLRFLLLNRFLFTPHAMETFHSSSNRIHKFQSVYIVKSQLDEVEAVEVELAIKKFKVFRSQLRGILALSLLIKFY
jgi:hypothetical protein